MLRWYGDRIILLRPNWPPAYTFPASRDDLWDTGVRWGMNCVIHSTWWWKFWKIKNFFGSCSARRSFLQNLEYSVLHSELVFHNNIMALLALSLVHVYAIMFFVIWSSLISPTIGPDSESSLPQSGPFCGEWWYHYTTCTAFSWVSPIAKHGSWGGIFRNTVELFRLILSCNPAFFILSYATPASAGRSEVKDGQDLQSTDPYPSVG